MDDFSGTTISLTNPGTIGTNHSVPRLTAGQGAIIGVGAMEYPAEFQGMNPDALTEMAVSKIITLTSTYDHRIIQGAESGDFLRRLHALLLGEDGFYDEVFRSLRIPYEPVRWMPDVRVSREGQIDKEARVIEVIESYRRNGHLMADRKSTRLNSSHANISYAVFCLKKKITRINATYVRKPRVQFMYNDCINSEFVTTLTLTHLTP